MSAHPAWLSAAATLRRVGVHLVVEWASTQPAGTLWQVYQDKNLLWSGTDRTLTLPYPRTRTRIDVIGVDAGEGSVDYSAGLSDTGLPAERVTLSWLGGSFQSATLAGFNIYQSLTAGGAVSYAARVGYVPAASGGKAPGGWDFGGWDAGKWDQPAGSFSWRSGPLTAGVWAFAVAAVDAAGNQVASPVTSNATVASAPHPPGPNSAGVRLTYTFNPTGRIPTLNWLAPV